MTFLGKALTFYFYRMSIVMVGVKASAFNKSVLVLFIVSDVVFF